MAMTDRDDFRRAALDAIDDAVVATEDFADVRAFDFGDDAPGERKVRKRFDGRVDPVDPVQDRQPVLALHGHVAGTIEKPLLPTRRPFHRPSSRNMVSASPTTC